LRACGREEGGRIFFFYLEKKKEKGPYPSLLVGKKGETLVEVSYAIWRKEGENLFFHLKKKRKGKNGETFLPRREGKDGERRKEGQVTL